MNVSDVERDHIRSPRRRHATVTCIFMFMDSTEKVNLFIYRTIVFPFLCERPRPLNLFW